MNAENAESSGRGFTDDDSERPGRFRESSSSGLRTAQKDSGAAGAFAKHLGISPRYQSNDDGTGRAPLVALRESNDGRSPFIRAGTSQNDSKVSVGPLSGWAREKKREERDESDTKGREKMARKEDHREIETEEQDEEEDLERCDEHADEELDCDRRTDDKEDDAASALEVEKRQAESEALVGHGGSLSFPVRVMSGDHRDCGICLQRFDDEAGVKRHVLWPCQHARQCGDCAIRIWQVPKQKRRCPWCKSKIDIRPRPFKPFL
jgi:hypothetical protein